MKWILVAIAIVACVNAAVYDLVPALAFEGDVYVPLSQVSRIARSAQLGVAGGKAGAFGGSDATATSNSQTQSFTGPGFSGTSSSSGSSSSSRGGLGGTGASANAESAARS